MITAISLSACKNQDYIKVKEGGEYRMIAAKGGKLVTNGNIIEMQLLVKYKDSVLFNSYEMGMPQYVPYDTSKFPAMYKEIFKTLHVGDSIIIRESTDSLIKRQQNAPFMKKGDFVYQYYKVTNAYATEAEAENARTAAGVVAEAKAKVKSHVLRQWPLPPWLKTSGSTFASHPETSTIFKPRLLKKQSLIKH